MHYINSIIEAIGQTPLLKLNNIGKNIGANIFVKLEYLNPSGSYKDRMALAMIEGAENGDTWNGKSLKPGGVVIEASAGNTAPAIAMVCASKGYHARLVLYRYSIHKELDARMKITGAYGPEVSISSEPDIYISPEELASISKDCKDLPHVIAAKIDCARQEAQEEGSVWLDQIYNKNNYRGQENIGKEIFDQLDGKIDAFGCSVGSGGTLYGTALGLRDCGVRPEIIFGVVPYGTENYINLPKDECSRGEFAYDGIADKIAAGMGLDKWTTEQSIIQEMMADNLPDKFFRVSDAEALDMANRLAREEGIYCGMSSGANVSIALKIAERLGPGKNVVTVIVDRRDRYITDTPYEKYAV